MQHAGVDDAPASAGGGDVHDRVRQAYLDNHVKLWRAVAGWSGSSDVADDAIAETFAQLLRRGEAVEDPAAWAWRTAFRIAAAELQRRRADARCAVDEIASALGASDSVLDLMRALHDLTDQQRACVVVCDLLGYSSAEAAPLLQTSAATVRVQRMRARRRLRAQLEGPCLTSTNGCTRPGARWRRSTRPRTSGSGRWNVRSSRRDPLARRIVGRGVGAVAAVLAALVLLGSLVLGSDDQDVHTGPAAEDVESIGTLPEPSSPAARTIVSGHGCPFGIAGDPIEMELGPVDPGSPRFDAEPGQNIAHTVIGAQVAEMRVPEFSLRSTDGWRWEDIQLARGPARVWLDGPPSGEQGKPFVQVRWTSGSEETCSSFTVTVDGGTELDNRDLAVALADRILLPGELDDPELPGAEGGPVAGLDLRDTEWVVDHTSDGSAPPGATMSFTESTVRWEEGCATATADYELDRTAGILTLTNRSSTNPGCTPPIAIDGRSRPWSIIRAVMEAERISVAWILDRGAWTPGDPLTGILRLGDPAGGYVALERA